MSDINHEFISTQWWQHVALYITCAKRKLQLPPTISNPGPQLQQPQVNNQDEPAAAAVQIRQAGLTHPLRQHPDTFNRFCFVQFQYNKNTFLSSRITLFLVLQSDKMSLMFLSVTNTSYLLSSIF